MLNLDIQLSNIIQTTDKYLWKNRKNLDDIDFVIGVSRGGLIPAVWIATHLNKPFVTAYIDKQDDVFVDRIEWIKGKSILLVDDVIRSGKTSYKIEQLLLSLEIKSIKKFFVYEDKLNNLKMPWDIYE